MYRALLQSWLRNAAKARVQEAVVQSAREQLAPATEEPADEESKPCRLGVVFALGIESGGFEDLLQGVATTRGQGFVAREGGLKGQRVVVILAGAGRDNAARATEALIDGHRPRRVVSAGFAGALSPELRRSDILVADALLDPEGGRRSIELPPGLSSAALGPGVHRGVLLTADRVVRLPREKQSLFQQHGALAVDMETTAVAEVCRSREVAFSSVRVINDTSDETLPTDVEHLLAQTSNAARLGAAVGAIWRRPASAKDMYQLRENALVASDRLARFLADTQFD